MVEQVIDVSGLLKRPAMVQHSLFGDDLPSPSLASISVRLAGVRSVATTPEVDQLLAAQCVVAQGISGGKDSAALALAVAKHLDAIGHKGPRVLVHSDLGRVEWKDSLPACERLAKYLGWELIVLRRNAGDMLARWEGRWANNVARYEALSCVKMILPWSTPSMRFCTSELKSNLIASALRKRFPTHHVLNVVGIRREESPNRSKMPVAARNPMVARRGFIGMTWNAIIEWPVQDVWAEIAESGVPAHEAYERYGSSRVSCVYCIMSSGADLLAAVGCEDNHDVYRSMVELEAESTFAFQGARWLADVAPHLLGDDLAKRVAHAKAMAIVRQQAEAELPKHLLFTKGWPEGLPTPQEAELIASVRRRVNAALGLSSQFLDADSVMQRYSELLAAKNGGSLVIEDDDDEREDAGVLDLACA